MQRLPVFETFFTTNNKIRLLMLLGWGVFIVYSFIYCRFYTTYVDTAHPGLKHTVIWFATEYGPWLPASPLLLHWLNKAYRQHLGCALGVALAAAVVMTLYRLGLDFYLNPTATFPANLVYFMPTHLTFALVIFLGWFALIRTDHADAERVPQAEYAPQAERAPQASSKVTSLAERTAEATLDVQKGNINKQLPITHIDSITAAGNYMEVAVGSEVYLTRSTLNELEQQLPSNQFVRIHRSCLVNIDAVVNVLPKGNGYLVALKNQQSLPLSKQRKPALDQQLARLY
jgi:DNA-binding LytR/AlgR family response regulator